MKKGKLLALCLALAVLFSVVFSGCANDGSPTAAPSVVPDPSESPAPVSTSPSAEEDEPVAYTFPFFEKTLELSMWIPLQRTNMEYITTYADITSMKYIMDKMNVNITFQCPAFGQEQTSFSLLLASGDYPDMSRQSEAPSGYFTSGAEQAIADEIIIDMTDIIDNNMPYYKAIRDSSDEIRKGTKTDSGKSWAIYLLNAPRAELPYNGLVVRKDWCDDLGLAIPETIEDWDKTLTAFKKTYNGGALWTPASGLHFNSEFLSAWNIGKAFFKEGNVVKYGPIQDSFKEYVTMMSDWYTRGLIHRDFVSNTDQMRVDKALMASGETGASNTQIASARNAMVIRGEVEDPNFYLEPVVGPVMNKGDVQHFGLLITRVRAPISIFADSKNITDCAKFMDYFYSPEGIMLVNYGIPGEQWYLDSGEDESAVINDLINNKHEGEGLKDVFANGKVHQTEAFLSDVDTTYGKNLLNFTFMGVNLIDNVLMVGARGDRSADISASLSGEVWSMAACDYVLPTKISMTADESSQFGAMYADIETYVSECTAKMITGIMPISEFDKMVSQVKTMGIDQCIQFQQAALDRYNAR